jgi:hypothetical protein
MKDNSARVFLTAEWRHLAMLNYEADPKILAPFVPAGTELDFFNGNGYLISNYHAVKSLALI